MTKSSALNFFFSSFGVRAYPETEVPTREELIGDGVIKPEESEYPYLTYQNVQDNWGAPVALTVNLWWRTKSERLLNDKVYEISAALPRYVPCDGGAILFSRGSPFSQALTDDTDPTIKRRYMNVIAEYLTLN